MSEDYIPAIIEEGFKTFSGADMEAALTRAKFRAAAEKMDEVTPAVLDLSLADFIPPTYPDEVELQTLNAVIECTSKELLPERYREMDRNEILSKIEELKFKVG